MTTTRTITLGENDAAVIFRDQTGTKHCHIEINLEPQFANQVELPAERSASYLALLASTPFQQDGMAQLIASLCHKHLSTSAGLDHTPIEGGNLQ